MSKLNMYNPEVIITFVTSGLQSHYENGGDIIEQYHLCFECAYLFRHLEQSVSDEHYETMLPSAICKNCGCELGLVDDNNSNWIP